MKGVYILTEEDAKKGRTFEDAIAWRSGFLDQGGERGGQFTSMPIHEAPYRSILAENLDGVLVGGRPRRAAALSGQKNIVPRDLKVPEPQARLRGVSFKLSDREQKGLR